MKQLNKVEALGRMDDAIHKRMTVQRQVIRRRIEKEVKYSSGKGRGGSLIEFLVRNQTTLKILQDEELRLRTAPYSFDCYLVQDGLLNNNPACAVHTMVITWDDSFLLEI